MAMPPVFVNSSLQVIPLLEVLVCICLTLVVSPLVALRSPVVLVARVRVLSLVTWVLRWLSSLWQLGVRLIRRVLCLRGLLGRSRLARVLLIVLLRLFLMIFFAIGG